MADKRERLTIELPGDLRTSLDRWAESEGRATGNLLRRIAALAVARHERKRAKAEAAA